MFLQLVGDWVEFKQGVAAIIIKFIDEEGISLAEETSNAFANLCLEISYFFHKFCVLLKGFLLAGDIFNDSTDPTLKELLPGLRISTLNFVFKILQSLRII